MIYPDKVKAQQAALALHRAEGWTYRVYKCWSCPGYHLTTKDVHEEAV